jgi:hypothetical protein
MGRLPRKIGILAISTFPVTWQFVFMPSVYCVVLFWCGGQVRYSLVFQVDEARPVLAYTRARKGESRVKENPNTKRYPASREIF